VYVLCLRPAPDLHEPLRSREVVEGHVGGHAT
jgi:hypothetical protein